MKSEDVVLLSEKSDDRARLELESLRVWCVDARATALDSGTEAGRGRELVLSAMLDKIDRRLVALGSPRNHVILRENRFALKEVAKSNLSLNTAPITDTGGDDDS